MPYVPTSFTGELTLENLQSYFEEELLAISRESSETPALDLRPVNAEPLRPREGMIVFADGSDWDPGSGKGLYVYKGTSWEFIA